MNSIIDWIKSVAFGCIVFSSYKFKPFASSINASIYLFAEYTIEPNTGEVTPTEDVMDSIIPSDPQDLFNVTSGSGNTESPESGGGSGGGGGFDLSDLIEYGTPLVGAGLSLYDYFKRQGEAEDLEEANRRAAERADPWGDYRPGYAQRLNEFMQTSPNLPDAPNRQSPLDFAQDNPYVSTSGLNEFLQNTPTPIERMEANPFVSQSGLFELLKDPNSIKESPAYQFRLNQGLNALDRRLASA
ncbi:hypothetical protein, partial [Schnuerera sp.]|uniref:hypothetical protein n=1 Tax=Schnuerera sp. TaxID=2794844 RepID=UPI002B62F8FC